MSRVLLRGLLVVCCLALTVPAFAGLPSFTVSPSTTSSNVSPGESVDFPLTLTNGTGSQADMSFQLLGVTSNWTATAYADSNGNKILDGAEGNTAINSFTAVPNTESRNTIVRLAAPADAAASSQGKATLALTAPADGKQPLSIIASNTCTMTATVLSVDGITLLPDTGAKSTTAGGVVDYSVDITNSANYTQYIGVATSGLPTGWAAAIYRDSNRNGSVDGGETTTAQIDDLAAGNGFSVVVRVTAASDASAGATGAVTLTATSLAVKMKGGPISAQGDLTTKGTYTTTVLASRGVDVTPATSLAYSDPGSSVDYPASIENIGNSTDTFSLGVSGLPVTWTATIYEDSNGNKVLDQDEQTVTASTGAIEGSSSYHVIVRVEVPAGAAADSQGDVTLTATAVASTDKSRLQFNGLPSDTGVFTTRVNFVEGLVVDPPTASLSRNPGQAGDFAVSITNTGNVTSTIGVGLSGAPATWTAEVYGDSNSNGAIDMGESVTTGFSTVAAGSVRHVVVRLTPASGASAFDTGTVTLTASTNATKAKREPGRACINCGASDSGSYTVVVNPVRSVTLTPATASSSADPGAVADYPATITNTGNDTTAFALTATGLPTGWTTTIYRDTNGNGALDMGESTVTANTDSLARDGHYDVIVRVSVPSNAQGGDQGAVTLKAAFVPKVKTPAEPQSGAIEISDTGVYTTTVHHVPGVDLAPAQAAQSCAPGATVDYPATITNTSNFQDGFALTATGLPTGWSATIFEDDNGDGSLGMGETSIPNDTGLLATGETFHVVVRVSTPANGLPGTQGAVTLKATENVGKAKTGRASTYKGVVEASGTYTTTLLRTRGVELTPTAASRSVLPGGLADYAVSITNTGSTTDEFRLSEAGLPAGWSAQIFHDADGDGSLGMGETTTTGETGLLEPEHAYHVVLRVSVPADAAAGDTGTTTLTAEGFLTQSKSVRIGFQEVQPTATGEYHTTVLQVHAAELTPVTSQASRLPGFTADYPVTITNTGNGADRFTITTAGLPSTWTAQVFADDDGDGVLGAGETQVTSRTGILDPEQSYDVIVRVLVPGAALAGDRQTVQLTLDPETLPGKLEKPRFLATGSYETTVLQTFSVDLAPRVANASRLPGAVADYAVTITNTGNGPDAFDLVAAGLPTGWTAQVFHDEDGDGILDSGESTQVTSTDALGPNGSYDVIVVVTVPAGAPAGDTGAVTLTARSASGVYTTTVLQAYGVELTPATATASRLPGKTADYPATITNTGNGVDDFMLSATGLPGGWTASVLRDDDRDGALGAGETTVLTSTGALGASSSAAVVVRVAVPTSARGGDTGSVTLTASSRLLPAKTGTSRFGRAGATATGTYETRVLQPAVLSVERVTASTALVVPGETGWRVTLSIRNTGAVEAASVSQAAPIFVGRPGQFTAVADAGNPAILQPGEELPFGFTVAVDASAAEGFVTIDGQAAGAGAVSELPTSTGAAKVTTAWEVVRPTLAFVGAVQSAATAHKGDTLDVTVTVRNTGRSATSLDSLALRFIGAGSSNATSQFAIVPAGSNAATLAASATAALTFQVTVGQTVAYGPISIDAALDFTDTRLGIAGTDSEADVPGELTILNRAPIASVASATALTGPKRLLLLDGTGSSDPDDDSIAYSWSLIAKPSGAAAFSADTATTQYDATVPGTYMFRLTVTDTAELSDSASIAFIVSIRAPVAIARGAQRLLLPSAGLPASIATTLTAHVDGTASFHPDDLSLTYRWRIIRAPDVSEGSSKISTLALFDDARSPRPLVTFDGRATSELPNAPLRAPGLYTFQLTVSDGVLSDTDTVDIEVLDPKSLLPNADPGLDRAFTVERNPDGSLNVTIPDPTLPDGGRSPFVRLDGRESADSFRRPLTYRWTVTRMPPGSLVRALQAANTPFPFFTPDEEGTYEFELIVNNGIYDSIPNRVRVVISASNHAPTAIALVRDPATGRRSFAARPVLAFKPGDTVELTGVLSTDPDSADRGRLVYQWTQTSGEQMSLAPNASATTVTFDVTRPGFSEFRLTVTDPQGVSDESDVGVLVRDPSDDSTLSIVSSASTTDETGVGYADRFTTTRPRSLRVTLPTTVTLTGTVGGTFPAGQTFDFLWTQVEGPVVLLSSPGALGSPSRTSATSFVPTTSRVHLFDLTVFPLDASGNRQGVFLRQLVRVIVDSSDAAVPEPSGTVFPVLIPLVGPASSRTITLDGSQSRVVKASAIRGQTLFYSWRQVDGPRGEFDNPYKVITTFTAPEFTGDETARDYLFELTVDVTPPGDRSEPLYFQVLQQGVAAAGPAAGVVPGCNCGVGGCQMNTAVDASGGLDMWALLALAFAAIALRARPRRAAALAPLFVLLGLTQASAGVFSDVPRDHWAYKAVERAVDSGILSRREGRFLGGRTATRYQMATMVARMLDRVEAMKPGSSKGKSLADLEALTIEFADELALLNVKVSALEDSLAALKADVEGLKKDTESGGWLAGVRGLAQARLVLANAESNASALARGRTLPVSRYPGSFDVTGTGNGRTFFDVAQTSLAIDRHFDEDFYLHAQIDFDASNESGFVTADNVQINEAYVELERWLADGDVRVRLGAWALPFSRERDPEMALDSQRRFGFRTLDLTITPTLWDQTWERVRNIGAGLLDGHRSDFQWQVGVTNSSGDSSVENGSLLLTRQFAQAASIGAGPNLLAALAGDPAAQAAAARFAAGPGSFGNRRFGLFSLQNQNLYGDTLSGVDVNGGPVAQDNFGFYGWAGDRYDGGFRWDAGYYSNGGDVTPGPNDLGTLNEWDGVQVNAGYWGWENWGLMASYFKSTSTLGAGLPEIDSQSWSALVNRKLGDRNNVTLRYEDARDELSATRFEAKTWTIGWNHALGAGSLLQLEYSAPDTLFTAPGARAGDACDEQFQANYKIGF